MPGILEPIGWPRWGVMWSLAMGIYGGLKLFTWLMCRGADAPAWKHWAYSLGWPGMDCQSFLTRDCLESERPTGVEWWFALTKASLGVALIWSAPCVAVRNGWLAGWVGMIGIVFVLHFGLFHLLSCLWRKSGVSAPPLMNWPVLSESLSEFWGRRWNRAFRDLTFQWLFRPWRRRLGAAPALLAGFVVSGLIHDVVISLPASGGYGGPTAYFTLQGAGVLLEKSPFGKRLGLGHGWCGRAFAAVCLAAPLGWLFHGPFVCRVILPFLNVVGGAG